MTEYDDQPSGILVIEADPLPVGAVEAERRADGLCESRNRVAVAWRTRSASIRIEFAVGMQLGIGEFAGPSPHRIERSQTIL